MKDAVCALSIYLYIEMFAWYWVEKYKIGEKERAGFLHYGREMAEG